MLMVEIKDNNGNVVGIILLDEKQFKTGSVGYHGQGKVMVNGKKHQANFMLVEIGSKPSK